MKAYEQIFTLEINKTLEEAIDLFKKNNNSFIEDTNITINLNPPWYKVFAGRGIVTLKPEKSTGEKTTFQCVLKPTIADTKTIAIFLLWNIPTWIVLLNVLPFNLFLFVIFFIEWLVMAFVAIPILILFVLITTLYILYNSLNLQNVYFVVIIWSFLFLLVHSSLRYNRGELKMWIIKLLM